MSSKTLTGLAAMLLAFVAGTSALSAQATREITGRVTQVGGGPLADAHVAPTGVAVGVRSNAAGDFRMLVNQGEVTLVARAIGFKRMTVKVPAGQSVVNFILEKDVLQLEGVTVSGISTTIEKRNAATAVVLIQTEDITKVSSSSLEQALQGKVLGASINMNNGAPGGGAQVQIRGASSLIGRIDPLYVVDGVIISNAVRSSGQSIITGSLNSGEENSTNRLADLNSSDIESIEVLKSAGASAIYGSQATNGVVVITTKKGNGGAPRFTLEQRVGSSQLIRSNGTRKFNTALAVTDLRDNISGGNAEMDQVINAKCKPASCPYYDYIGQLYGRTDPSYETILSMTGGTGNTRYFASAHDRQEPGIAWNTGARRQSIRANVDQAIGSRITLSIGSNVMHSFSQRGISNNDNSFASPIYGIAYTPGIADLATKDSTGQYVLNPFPAGISGSTNPFQTFALMTSNEDVYRVILSGRLSWAAYNEGRNSVNFSFNGGADRSSNEAYILAPQILQFERLGTGQGGPFPGTAIQGNGTGLLTNATLGGVWTYSHPKFTSTFSGGGQIGDRYSNDYTIIGRGLGPLQYNSAGATNTSVRQSQSVIRNQAFYVQEDVLALGEKLYMSASVRGERASVNGDPKKVFYFPRFAASYRLTNPGLKIDEVKFRANYGQSGNQPNYGDRYVAVANYGIISGQTGYGVPGSVGNPTIRPERLSETELGADISIFHERVHLEITHFQRDITDLLVRPLLAPTTGVSQTVVNGGTMSGKGWEVGSSFIPIENWRGVQWLTRLSWQQNESRITSFPPGVLPFTIGAAGGFGNAYGRLRFQPGFTASSVYGNYQDPVTKAVTPNTKLGDANPRATISWGNEVSWKKWAFSMLVDYRSGGTVSNMTQNLFDEGHNTWDYDKTSPVAGKPLGAYRYDNWSGGANTSAYLVDGSVAKVREISVSVELPARLVTLMPGARTMRASLSGRNLFIISPYASFDPEVNNGGNQVARFVDLAPYPPSRSFEFKLNVGF